MAKVLIKIVCRVIDIRTHFIIIHAILTLFGFPCGNYRQPNYVGVGIQTKHRNNCNLRQKKICGEKKEWRTTFNVLNTEQRAIAVYAEGVCADPFVCI